MPPVFITGGSGFVGRYVIDGLLAEGCEVSALSRRPGERRPGLEWIVGDLDTPESYGRALRGADAVIHLAALIAARRVQDFDRSNVQGTRTLLHACARGRPRRVVVVSSIAAAGPKHDGSLLTEGDACRPRSAYGASKLAAEREALALADQVPVTILRPSYVYGPGDARGAEHLRTLLQHAGRPWRTPIATLSLIHAADLARVCLLSLRAAVPSGSLYLISDSRIHTWDSLRRAVASALMALGREGALDPRLADALIARAEALEVTARGAARYDYWACDTAKARAELGLTARSLAEGARETIGCYLRKGLFAPAPAIRRTARAV
jgi:nucleoside-diphosphate-sugar epimerase